MLSLLKWRTSSWNNQKGIVARLVRSLLLKFVEAPQKVSLIEVALLDPLKSNNFVTVKGSNFDTRKADPTCT